MIYTVKPKKVSIYINTGRKTIAQVKAETGCDAVINGGFYNMNTFKPCCVLIADGNIHAYEWNGEGYCFDTIPPVFKWSSRSDKNFVYGVPLVVDGKARTPLDYAAEWGGARQRTAIGRYPDGRLWLYCDKAGKTPEQLRQIALDAGLDSAIMLDGGGSSQCIFPGGSVTSSRIVHNFICVWADGGENGEKGEKKLKVCLDPGHGTKEMNQSPDGTYIEHKFALDMANRIRWHLVRCGVDVKLTREDNSTPTLTERANIANAYKADLLVSLHSNAVGSSGWNDNTRGLTVWTYAAGGERDRAAKLLLAEMKQAGVQTFGSELYHQKFTVLAKTNMPAYLIEYAFHTSRPDVKLLLDNAHRDKLALATAKAICIWGGVKWVDAPTSPTKPADGTIYRVQVGAFTQAQNAENLKAELESKGYKPFIVKEVKA